MLLHYFEIFKTTKVYLKGLATIKEYYDYYNYTMWDEDCILFRFGLWYIYIYEIKDLCYACYYDPKGLQVWLNWIWVVYFN